MIDKDINTPRDEYSGTAKTTDSNVESIEAINDSSASITRQSGGQGRAATAEAGAGVGETEITVETTESCSDTGGDGGSNIAPEAIHIYPTYSGNDIDMITLLGLAVDADADLLTYNWYRGTDTTGTPEGSGKTYNLGDQSCSYSQDWTLQVSDGDLTDTVTHTIEASNGCQSGGGPGNPNQPIQQ